jgi:PAS domain S-box-containing protein
MESVTGRRSVRAVLTAGWGRDAWLGFAIGILWLTGVAVIDVAVRDSAIIGGYVVAPFLTALIAGVPPTLAIGVLMTGVAAVSGIWNDNFGTGGYELRLAVDIAGTAFAAGAAWNRDRAAVRGERMRTLDAVGEIADGSRPLDETLRRVVELTVPRVADICMIDAIHGGRAMRTAVGVAGHPGAEQIEAALQARPPSLPGWLVREERSWRHIPRWRPRLREEEVRRMARSGEDFEFLSSLGLRSSIVVPIAARNRNLGALTLLQGWSRRRYTEDDVRYAQILASRIGLALDNAGLFSDLESVERRMDSVMSILDEAVVIHDRDGALVYANPAAARTMGFATPEDLIAAPTEKISERYVIRDEHGRPVDAEGLAGRRALQGDSPEPLMLRVIDRATHRETWRRTMARPILGADGTPLYSVTVIEDVTDVMRAEFAQRLLAGTGDLLAATRDYRGTLEDVGHLLVPEFADWCSVDVPGENGAIEQVAVAHTDPAQVERAVGLRRRYPVRADDEVGVAEVLRTGEARLMPDVPDELLERAALDDEHLRLLRDLDIGSAILVPMTAGGKVGGALTFVNARDSRSFDTDDLDLAVEVARRAGVAIENARLAQERARVAATLQRELLPPNVPEMPGWQVSTMYRPAGEVEEVGGDFYEAFAVEGGWALVLGDVSGRGAQAASLTAEARHTIRTAATLAPDPRVGLRLVDERLRERGDAALCSAAVLLLSGNEEGDARATLFLAGHPPPLLLRDGGAEEVGMPGPILGVSPDAVWESETVVLRPGDLLVLYTDGVIEAKADDGERFGAARLRHGLAGCGRPEAVIARVEGALAAFAGEADDDAAVVAVQRVGRPDVVSQPREWSLRDRVRD